MTVTTQESAVLIGGRWTPSLDGQTVPVISPATEEPVAHVTLGGAQDMEARDPRRPRGVRRGPVAADVPARARAVLARASELLMERHDEIAETITQEVGTPIKQTMRSRVTNVRDLLDVHVALAETYPWVEIRDGMRSQVEIRQEPVGVVGAIVPWNVPFSLTAAKLAPALLTGCTVVLKPAEETPLNAIALSEILTEAGLPEGVLSVIPADRDVSATLVSHPAVDKISFTGSTVAGKAIASICGQQLKRYSLELGGKSAAIILEDADLEQTLARLLPATINNNGQVCVNQTRIVAPRGRYDEIVEAFTEGYRALEIGDPMDPATDVGPLIHGQHRDRVEGYIKSGRDEGARVTIGGGRPEGLDRGFYVEPTIFADVDNGDDDRPGGDLRPGAVDHPLRRRGRGRADRQRLRLRAVRHRLGPGSRARGEHRAPRPHREHRRQPLHARLRRAVRRHEGVRHRPRVRAGGDRRVHGDPVHPPGQAGAA